MANKYYQLITPDVSTETFTFVSADDDYSKYILEGEISSGEIAYVVTENPYTEEAVQEMGAQEISQDEFDAYFRRIGGHPPTKP